MVRSDHLHRHMKNKHPEVNHPGPQSNRRKKRDDQLELSFGSSEYQNDQNDNFGPNTSLAGAQGLSALLSQNASVSGLPAALNANAIQQLIQAGLLNPQGPSGTSLNLFGTSRFSFPSVNDDETVEDDEDEDGPLVIACEDDSGDDSVEEIEPNGTIMGANSVIKGPSSPPLTPNGTQNIQFNNHNYY